MDEKEMKEMIQIDGGLGRCIDFTGVLKKYCQKNPTKKVDIMTPHPDVFFNMSWINRVYPIDTPYLYDTAIKNAKYKKPEPYDMYEYYNELKHITQCFDKELTGEEELLKPEVILTAGELSGGEEFINKLKKDKGKEVILFQPHGSSGGKSMQESEGKFKCVPDDSGRSLTDSFANRIYKALQEKYEVLIIKMPDQIGITDAMTLQRPDGSPMMFRHIAALIPHVKACVGCDSFLAHACATMNKKCYTFWGSTSPKNLAYDSNMNFEPNIKPEVVPNRIPHNMMDTYKRNAELINCYGEKHIKALMDDLKNEN